MREKINLLIVEDSEPMALAYGEFVKDACRVDYAASIEEARRQSKRNLHQLVLLDIQLPDGSGLDLLREMREAGSEAGFILITADSSVETAVAALKEGADDFLEKPFSAERLRTTLRNTIEKRQLRSLVQQYEIGTGRKGFQGFIGGSMIMQGVYHMVEASAPSKATVFITGESGTGKEVLARAIHDTSPRAEGRFVALNCGAIPRELMESEIFGHIKGAFTGAEKERKGAALLADGGTLFLDEVCEMDLELQVKLLRFLQTEVFRPVGSDIEKMVDVRIVCATNKDPMTEVRAGRFREDLYYRLHVINIALPALRERSDDVLMIAENLLNSYAAEEGKNFSEFSDEVIQALLSYRWPGNVRELQNVMRQIVVLNQGRMVSLEMLPLQFRAALDATIESPQPEPPVMDLAQASKPAVMEEPAGFEQTGENDNVADELTSTVILPLWKMEEKHIERALTACNQNIPKAAAILEVSPSTLYRKLKSGNRD